jgi:GT2 family glycosyltransferase
MKSGLSVLIVNYDGEKYIKTTIDSLIECLGNLTFEIIIVDNDSSDNSVEIISNIIKNKKNICFYPMKMNLGFAKGNNFLAEKAQYNNLLLINNDTRSIDLSEIKRILQSESCSDDIIYTCRIYNEDGTNQQNVFGRPNVFKLILELFLIKRLIKKLIKQNTKYKSFEKSYFSGCFLLMKRKKFKAINGFDERFDFYHEEADFFLRQNNQTKLELLSDKIIHFGGGGKEMSEFAFKNYFIGLYKLFAYNKLINKRILKVLFIIGLNYRIMMLYLGIKIRYQPIDMYKNNKSNRNRKEIIALHKILLKNIHQTSIKE